MGNNVLNVCKNTIAPTEQNEGGDSENNVNERPEKPKRIKPRKSDVSAPNTEIKSQKVHQNISPFGSGGSDSLNSDSISILKKGKGINVIRSPEFDNYSNSQDGALDIRSLISPKSNVRGEQNAQPKAKLLAKESSIVVDQTILDLKIPTHLLQDNQQNTVMVKNTSGLREDLKNNNDKYFSKEDYTFYETLYKNQKKLQHLPSKNKNIRWQSGEVLGTGSFGQVILGMNIDTGEFMAVKQVYIEGYNEADRQEKVQQIQSEIEALQNFSDKHIVRYIGIKKSEKSINIFLEYVPGGSIASLLFRYGKFNETLIRKFVQQILQGLEYLHAHEIIHRDIKGANVLVDKDGNCKLADFGSAKKIVEEKGHTNSIRGTPYWMAPEMIKQTGSGRFADIWSLGCTVIEMATAKPPWADRSPIQAMFFIANTVDPPPIPDFLSSECRDFISKCLKINPNERWNVRQLLGHPFIANSSKSFNNRQLAQITEENSMVDPSTSSPGKAKDYLTRGESRGNTLFHSESMRDTMTEHSRAFTHKTTKTSKHANHNYHHYSNQATYHSRKLVAEQDKLNKQPDLVRAKTTATASLTTSQRQVHLQPQIIQSRTVVQPQQARIHQKLVYLLCDLKNRNNESEGLSPTTDVISGENDLINIPSRSFSDSESDDSNQQQHLQKQQDEQILGDSIPKRKKHQSFKRSFSQSLKKDGNIINSNDPERQVVVSLHHKGSPSHQKDSNVDRPNLDYQIEDHMLKIELIPVRKNGSENNAIKKVGSDYTEPKYPEVARLISINLSQQEEIESIQIMTSEEEEEEDCEDLKMRERREIDSDSIQEIKATSKKLSKGGSFQRKNDSDDNQDAFSKEKFGKLRFSKPTSPKLVSQASGTLANSSTFDLIHSNEQKPLHFISECTINNTYKDQIGSLRQENARDYAKYFGKQPSSQIEAVPIQQILTNYETDHMTRIS